MENKTKSVEEIEKIANQLRTEGKKIVTTNGSFDILHYGHVNLLQKAKREGDVLIVLLNSDVSIKRNKGPLRPIVNQEERAFMLSSLECVDFVVIFDEDTPLSLLEKIKPSTHVKGGSFIKERIEEEKELLEKWNGEFKSFNLDDGFSTTKIIEEILGRFK